MKILILGSKGMLGQELVNEFNSNNVIGLDKEELDISNFEITEQKIEEMNPDVVINSAAVNIVDKIEEDPAVFELAKKINGEAIKNLARICREKSKILIHYSSDYVFKGDNKNGYQEEDVTDPVNKYGITKQLGEKYLMEEKNKFYLIRLSKLFGKPAKSENAKKSFVDTMVYLATEGGKTHLDLVDEEQSCPTYAPDLAKFTRKILEKELPFGIYHGANSGICTWYELAKKTFEIKNIKIDIAPVSGDKFPRPAKRPMFSELINTKTEKQRKWELALEEYLTL